jgi:MFS transporter, PAT family, beta-lactamase induction signal transducer AmpG
VMSGSQAAGNVVGGAGLAAVLAVAGFRAAAALSLLLLCVAGVPTVLLRERPGERLLPWTRGAPALVEADRAWLPLAGSVRLLVRAVLARPSARALAVWTVAYFLSGCLGILMTAAAVKSHGFRQAEYASLGALGLGTNLIGAFIGGRLADRKGRAPVLAGALLLGAIAWAGFAMLAPHWSNKGVWLGQALVWGAASGAMLTVLTAVFMDLADSRFAATQFAVCMALGNLGSVVGRASAGALEARFPLTQLALGAAVAFALLAVWTFRSSAIFPRPRTM